MEKRANAKDLMSRFSKAEGGKQAFYSIYKRCYELSAPNANNVDKGSNFGNTIQPDVYDSTVSRAADSFVNTFVTTIFPPQTRWMELEPSEEVIRDISEVNQIDPDDVKEQLTAAYQEITDKFFDALNQSNFYSVIDQFSHDVFIGTGCLLSQRSNDLFDSASPLDFAAIAPMDIAVELAPNQKITGVFRKQSVRYSQIKYMWPEFDYSIITEKPSGSDDDFEKDFVEACVLEPSYKVMPNGEEHLFRWRYVVMCGNKIGYEAPYKSNPFITFFWSLLQGENVGRGLMTKLLPDANELQALVRLKSKWLQMHGLGMHSVVPSKMFNASTAKIRPNAVLMVKEQGAIQSIQPAGNPQVQQMGVEELRMAIKETALDFTIPSDPNMTATQVNYIAQRQLQIFAGVVGRIQFQLLWPIVQNCLDILIESGFISLPMGLDKISPYTTKLKILSPVGRVQNLNDLNATMNALGNIAQINPELIQDYVRTEDLPTWIFGQTGSPAKLLRSKEETEAIQQQKAQQQAAMMQMEMQKGQQ